VSDPELEEYECPSCRGLVDLGWKACPHCGVEFDYTAPEAPEIIARAPPAKAAPAPPAVSQPPAPPSTPDLPSQPVVPGTRAPITVAAVPPIEEDLQIIKSDGAAAPISIVEAFEPNLAPTVLASPARTPHLDELGELERMITEAVAKALKANTPAPPAPPAKEVEARVQSAPPLPSTSVTRRRGLAGFGLGLLAGGALGIVVGLNWDTWIRGDAASAIGTIQQLAIIGTAAVTGAGAAVLVLELARSRRRPARAA
jgi:hypothetical protein